MQNNQQQQDNTSGLLSVRQISMRLVMSQRAVRIRLNECVARGLLPDTIQTMNGTYKLTEEQYNIFHKSLWERRQLSKAHRAQAARAVQERRKSLLGRIGLR